MKIMLHLSGGEAERIVSAGSCSLNPDELVLVVFEKKFTSPYIGRGVSIEMPISGNVR